MFSDWSCQMQYKWSKLVIFSPKCQIIWLFSTRFDHYNVNKFGSKLKRIWWPDSVWFGYWITKQTPNLFKSSFVLNNLPKLSNKAFTRKENKIMGFQHWQGNPCSEGIMHSLFSCHFFDIDQQGRFQTSLPTVQCKMAMF